MLGNEAEIIAVLSGFQEFCEGASILQKYLTFYNVMPIFLVMIIVEACLFKKHKRPFPWRDGHRVHHATNPEYINRHYGW